MPDTEAIPHRFSCSERHPGLCWFDDAAIYDAVLRFEKNLVKLLKSVHMKQGLLRFASPEVATYNGVFYLAGTRARRHFAPIVIVLAHMHVVELVGPRSVVAFASTPSGRFDFSTAWTLGPPRAYNGLPGVLLFEFERCL